MSFLMNLFPIVYILGCVVGLCLIFKKAGEAWWKALVPVYSFVVWIRICGKGWKWYIYFLVPAINIFTFLLMVVETGKTFRRYSFWEQVVAVVFPWAYLICLGAMGKFSYTHPSQLPPYKVSEARDWAESIVFALVAAVIIRGFVVEFYGIPSSSMEKSLLTGDYLMVSKLAYGPRATMTPLSFPLVHNVLPLTDGKHESYLDWIKLPYHRYPGLRDVQRYDAVVFNYPDGDTMCTAFKSNVSYHELVREYGREKVMNDPAQFGKIRVRPVDKRENFVKRCIGLPGDTLQIVNQRVLIDGVEIEDPNGLQFTYGVMFKQGVSNPVKVLDDLGVSYEDVENALYEQQMTGTPYFVIPMTRQLASTFKSRFDVVDVQPIVYPEGDYGTKIFPNVPGYSWSVDNFGPVYIPKKGATVKLTTENLPLYRRVIEVYEGNALEVANGDIFINGVKTDCYTFKMDYYWMMGDNRHNSADSRIWGFVPEDHIVGRPVVITFSRDKDHGKVRWNRIFKNANAID